MSVDPVRMKSRSTSNSTRCKRAISCTAAMRPGEGEGATIVKMLKTNRPSALSCGSTEVRRDETNAAQQMRPRLPAVL